LTKREHVRESEPGAAISDSQLVKTTEKPEYGAMMLPRKVKEENATFW
jgi:hypothetical protein